MDKGEDPVITNDADSDNQTMDENTATQSLADKSEGTPEKEYDTCTNAQTADQTSQNNEEHLELSNHQNYEVSAKILRDWSTARRHETVG